MSSKLIFLVSGSFLTASKCIGCAKKIVQVGVKEVVYHQNYGMDDLTANLFKSVGIQLRQYHGLE